VRVTGPVEGDAFGAALLARYDGGSPRIVVERDDGNVDVDVLSYLGDVDDGVWWPWLRARLGDRVLDVGAGGGRAAVALQAEGVDVGALDVSAGAVEVCRRRGVTNTFHGGVADLAATRPEPFDAFLCLGNNLGLVGGTFLDALRAMGRDGARLVGTMRDPYATDDPVHLTYHEANRKAGRPAGLVTVRVRYQRLATPWFSLLWLSPDELAEVAATSGWTVTDLLPGPTYCAELRPA
jgi:SAM-dependent methyltransferase